MGKRITSKLSHGKLWIRQKIAAKIGHCNGARASLAIQWKPKWISSSDRDGWSNSFVSIRMRKSFWPISREILRQEMRRKKVSSSPVLRQAWLSWPQCLPACPRPTSWRASASPTWPTCRCSSGWASRCPSRRPTAPSCQDDAPPALPLSASTNRTKLLKQPLQSCGGTSPIFSQTQALQVEPERARACFELWPIEDL